LGRAAAEGPVWIKPRRTTTSAIRRLFIQLLNNLRNPGNAAMRQDRTREGAPDQRTMFTPERIAIEKLDGALVAERYAPRDSFAGHQMTTPWDPLHRAYFNGEALWTYLTTPFLLAMDGVRVEETESWREGSETWRVLRAHFPGSIETHCLIQDFFFGEDLMLRRHDYSVNIAGGFRAAQLTSDYSAANGIRLPTKRRAYTRGPDRRPIPEMLMVSIDISEVRFE
jgi:hypothetical protein